MTIVQLLRSVSFRLALVYGGLLAATTLLVLGAFYVQTVGVMETRIDRQIDHSSARLMNGLRPEDTDVLEKRIRHSLLDGRNSDTEIYLLLDASGDKRVGNIDGIDHEDAVGEHTTVADVNIVRKGKKTVGRLHVTRLPDGGLLVTGSDLRHRNEMQTLFMRASGLAALITLVMAAAGALFFQREVARRANDIRRTVARMADGEMRERVPVTDSQDEFTRLNRDINLMLDRLEQLMSGVRHISNTIAHNLRTPLTRILLHLRNARPQDSEAQAEALAFAEREIEELGGLFEKLLNLAEVESGSRRQGFARLDLRAVVRDVVDFYEPIAEECGTRLTAPPGEPVHVLGDADLLASAFANLVDNAIKHGGATPDTRVEVTITQTPQAVMLTVADNGCGVAEDMQPRLGQRFFRTRRDRPGHGLGLASVQAIARLHGGALAFESAHPGLRVRMALPTPP